MNSFTTAAGIIHQGGVIAYPTEACFGLGCHPENKQAIERIRELKSRSMEQGFILVSDALERLLGYLDWDALDRARQDEIRANWPGPVTWLIPGSEGVGPELTGSHDTLAVRVSAFASVRELCSRAASPLVSTSANLRGQPPLTSAAEVASVFGERIDYIIDLPVEGLENPSRIVDARTGKTIRAA